MDRETFDRLVKQIYSEEARRVKLFENVIDLERMSRVFHEMHDKTTARIIDNSLVRYYEYFEWWFEAANTSMRLENYGKAIRYYRNAGEDEIADYLESKHYPRGR